MKRKCEFCGKLFDRTTFPDGTLERPSVYVKRRFCSRQCATARRVGRTLAGAKERQGARNDLKENIQEILPRSLGQESTPQSRDQAAALVAKSPLEHLLAVMNDPSQPDSRRDKAAIAAAPFVHRKPGELGKKEQQAEAAKEVTKGRFAPMKPPVPLFQRKND